MHPGLAFPSEPSRELASSPGVLVGSLPREVKGDPRLPTLQTVSPPGPTLAFVPSAVHGTWLVAHLGAPCWPRWRSQPSLVYSPPLSCHPTGSTGHGPSHRCGGVAHFAPSLWLNSPFALWSVVLDKGPPHPGLLPALPALPHRVGGAPCRACAFHPSAPALRGPLPARLPSSRSSPGQRGKGRCLPPRPQLCPGLGASGSGSG